MAKKTKSSTKQSLPPPSSTDTKPTLQKVVLDQLKIFIKNHDSTWLFLFVPFLFLTITLFQSHFAHRKLGTLIIQPGREPSAVAIFPFAPSSELTYSPALQEVANGGFAWSEGPLWTLRPGHEGDISFGRLLFSAVKINSILKVEYDGMSRHAHWSGCRENDLNRKELTSCLDLLEPGSNGLAYNPIDGHVYACEHGSRSVTRLEKNGTHTNIVRLYQQQRFNSPNDLIFTKRGDIFFTDPNYGLKGTKPSEKEMTHQGVYFISRIGGKKDLPDNEEQGIEYDTRPILLIDDLTSPNGIALSPDETILYVVDSIEQKVMKYNITKMPRLRDIVKAKNSNQNEAEKNGGYNGDSSTGGSSSSSSSSGKKRKRRKQSLDELLNDLDDEEEEQEEQEEKDNKEKDNKEKDNKEKDNKEQKKENKQDDTIVATGTPPATLAIRKPILSQGELFFDFKNLVNECTDKINQYNGPDGVKIDTVGNLYVAGACGVHVIGTDGILTASLMLEKAVSNVAWGGDERLYVTASDSILRVDVNRQIIPDFPMIMTGLTEEEESGSLGFMGL